MTATTDEYNPTRWQICLLIWYIRLNIENICICEKREFVLHRLPGAVATGPHGETTVGQCTKLMMIVAMVIVVMFIRYTFRLILYDTYIVMSVFETMIKLMCNDRINIFICYCILYYSLRNNSTTSSFAKFIISCHHYHPTLT
jgi:hypothetical protein